MSDFSKYPRVREMLHETRASRLEIDFLMCGRFVDVSNETRTVYRKDWRTLVDQPPRNYRIIATGELWQLRVRDYDAVVVRVASVFASQHMFRTRFTFDAPGQFDEHFCEFVRVNRDELSWGAGITSLGIPLEIGLIADPTAHNAAVEAYLCSRT